MTDGYVTTKNEVRVMFPRLFNPKPAAPGKDPSYSVLAIMHKDSEEYADMKAAIEGVCEDAFGGKTKLVGRGNPIKNCAAVDTIREAEGKQTLFSKLDNPKDYYFFNASSRSRPGIVDVELNDVLSKDAVKDGYYCKLNVNVWTWSHSGTKGASVGLNHVQIVKEGERLASGGGVSDPRSVFKPLGKVSDEVFDNEFE